MELDGLTSDPTPLGEAAKATIALVIDHVGLHADVLKVQMLHGDSPLTVRSSQIDFHVPISCHSSCHFVPYTMSRSFPHSLSFPLILPVYSPMSPFYTTPLSLPT